MREAAEGKPVQIGLLQRYATDAADGARASSSSARARRPAGASPWSAPARPALPARTGSRRSATTSTVFEARDEAGRPQRVRHRGLQERPTISPRREVDFILGDRRHRRSQTGKALGRDFTLADLRRDYDAVFLGIGLGGVNALGARRRGCRRRRWTRSTTSPTLRQAQDLAGAAGRPPRRRHRRRHDGDRRRRAVQAPRRRGGDHRLPPRPGADERLRVTSRSWRRPTASLIRHWAAARRASDRRRRRVSGVELRIHGARTAAGSSAPARRCTLAGRQVFKAIGQTLRAGRSRRRRCARAARRPHRGRRRAPHLARRRLGRRRLRLRAARTSPSSAVEDGKQAALSIDRALRARWPPEPVRSTTMADLRSRLRAASSRPTRSGSPRRRRPTRPTTSIRAFEAGWGGVVWKTLGEDPPIVNVNGPRYGAICTAPTAALLGFNNIELITDRAARDQPARDQAGQEATGRTARWSSR